MSATAPSSVVAAPAGTPHASTTAVATPAPRPPEAVAGMVAPGQVPAGERIYRVHGSGPLRGTVTISGAKNAALPVLAAALLTDDACVFENVPDIADIRVMIEVLQHLGARVDVPGAGQLVIEARDITSRTTPDALATRLRGSFLVMGPLLARFGQASAPRPGGCLIGPRPVDVPIKGFEQLGARVAVVDERFAASGRLRGANLVLDYPSQTGTENLIMAAVLADGVTIIENASAEPEVFELVTLLQAMGGRITWIGPGTVAIQGVPRLHGVVYRLVPDRLEAGTYLIAAAITGGDVTVAPVVPRHLHAVTVKLAEAGVRVEEHGHALRVRVDRPLGAVDVRTYPYPGFPTDLQQPFGALLTQAHGESMIQETMYEDRLRYTAELAKMGAEVSVEGQTALIRGPARLKGAEVRALDLRAGAAVILAGLTADGETVVRDGRHVARGYTRFAENLRALGAACAEEVLAAPPASS
jgi:UDP-N-acetylglucosamine 1-carboxyvinyltransferase